MGDVLVVGVHSDAEIVRNKGPPIMDEKERCVAALLYRRGPRVCCD